MAQAPAQTAKTGFHLGIYVVNDAEIVDFAAPYGVFSVARRYDPELDVFLIADANRPVQGQAGFTVLPNYSFNDAPAMDAFLIQGGFGTRQEMHNRRLFAYIESLPATTLLTSVCTGSWIYARMGLLDGLCATNRKEPDQLVVSAFWKWHGSDLSYPAATRSTGEGRPPWPTIKSWQCGCASCSRAARVSPPRR